MIVYLSSATEQNYYDDLFAKKMITGPNPAQSFNNNIIKGLGKNERVISISVLPLNETGEAIEHFEFHDGNVDYYVVKHYKRAIRKIANVIELVRLVIMYSKEETPTAIVSDVTCVSANIATVFLKLFKKCPIIAIVTDLPTFMNSGKHPFFNKLQERFIKAYNGYIFLTQAMNDYVNGSNKPYIIMEGLFEVRNNYDSQERINNPRICLYSGAIWENAGIEQMIQGFDRANILNAELHIYGEGTGLDKIKNMCQDTRSVKYKGCLSIENIRKQQRLSTLLINPRRTEGKYTKYSFPSKTMEYMASGTPVLMTKLSGVPEEYFDYVYTVNDESVEGFKNEFERVLNKSADELERKGINAKNYIYENKSVKKQTKRIYDLILCLKRV